MRIAYVCTDPGIPVFGRKGASVHAQAVLTELVRAGHEVHLCTPRPGGELPSDDPLASVTVHPLPAIGKGAAGARERRAQASDAALVPLLSAIGPDLVYERYALWGHRMPAPAWAEETQCERGDAAREALLEEARRRRGPLAVYVHVPFCTRRWPSVTATRW